MLASRFPKLDQKSNPTLFLFVTLQKISVFDLQAFSTVAYNNSNAQVIRHKVNTITKATAPCFKANEDTRVSVCDNRKPVLVTLGQHGSVNLSNVVLCGKYCSFVEHIMAFTYIILSTPKKAHKNEQTEKN